MAEKSLHSICRWTFNPGKGGFVPADMRPEWAGRVTVRPALLEVAPPPATVPSRRWQRPVRTCVNDHAVVLDSQQE